MSGYSNFITAVVQLTGGYTLTDATSATPTDDSDFNAIIPSAIADAEGMMYRDPDLDFLSQRGTDASTPTGTGSRNVTIPAKFLTLEQVCLITPANTAPAAGTRINLSRVSPEWINAVYPTESYTAAPQYGESYYAMFNSTQIIIAPTPDAAYYTEFYGVVTQTPLSSSNPDTALTTYFGDVFLAASMIYFSGFMKNFSSAGADNPPQAISWLSHYQDLKKGAAFQSARQRYLSAGATAYPPAPQSATTR